MEELEQRAYDYLKFTAGPEIAEWAHREKNGTWEQALEAARNSRPETPA